MSDYTITIPADLNDAFPDKSGIRGITPADLRAHGKHAEHCPSAVYILRYLADEIERQAPREPGWYHIEYEKLGDRRQSVYWWDGHGWFVGQFPGARHADFGDDATITPVTIGRADS